MTPPLTAQQQAEAWRAEYNYQTGTVNDIVSRQNAFWLRLAEEREALKAQIPQWQPIETAPRDGCSVIAYQPGSTYPNGITFPATVGLASWSNGDALNPPTLERAIQPT